MRRVMPMFEHLRRAAVAYVVLLAALLLTLLAYNYVRETTEISAQDQLEETVRSAEAALSRRTNSYVDAMFGARALFYSSSSVDREEWRDYAAGIDLEDRYEGMQALGYAERVEPEERDEFVEGLSRASSEADLREPALRPEGERSVYFPITYVEPFDEVNRRLLGRDTYANPTHRIAMDRARDTGREEATGKVYLLSEAPRGSRADLALEPGFVVYLPIYREGEPIDTVEERRRALDGFVVGSLQAEGVLRGALESFGPSMDFEVYDGEELTPNNLIYEYDGVLRASESQESSDFLEAVGEAIDSVVNSRGPEPYLDQIELAGREYGLYFEALPGFEEGNNNRLPLFVLLSGLAVSLLLFVITYVLVRSRLRAEKAGRDLEDANQELEATNRELETFSYSVSHDLRAPLRSIDGFSQILIEDYTDEIDEEGKDYLGRVRAASQQMGRLIDDLLALSRVTRGALDRKRVDLSSLSLEVAEELREGRPDRTVEFSAQKGLEVRGDPRLLRVALWNLIGNAWKFTGKEPHARIEFGRDEELSRKGRVPVYYVRDNGAGFDMSYADKLFGAFQRLHGTDEFEGTGIGLATVQRVVHRHGGRIWAVGEVGRGATFYFTLRPGFKLDAAPREEGKPK